MKCMTFFQRTTHSRCYTQLASRKTCSRKSSEEERVVKMMFRLIINKFAPIRQFSTKGEFIRPAENEISWSTNVPVKLRMGTTDTNSRAPMKVQTMLRNSVEQFGDKTAMVSYAAENTWTYKEYLQSAENVAKGFLSLGLNRFGGVGIMGHNSPEWYLSSVGAIFAGGLSCGIYTTNSPSTVAHISKSSPLDLLVVDNFSTLDRLLEGGNSVSKKYPELKKVIVIDTSDKGSKRYENEQVISWKELLTIGQDIDLNPVDNEQAVNDACMLLYTSGTTGPPKAAMISHDNVTWTSRIAMDHYKWRPGKEVILNFLPLSHVAAQLLDIYMLMYVGGCAHFPDRDVLKGTLVDNLKVVRPTRLLAVPRVWEKIQEKMQAAGKESSFIKKSIGDWAKSAATEHHEAIRKGERKATDGGLQYKLAKELVFNRVKEALGLDQALSLYTGAAPLAVSTFEYFQSLDMVLLEVLGCTEVCGPQFTNVEGDVRPGTAGKSYYGVINDIRDGEIITQSRNVFMGYAGNEKATKDTFTSDGWFKTGDLAKYDKDGYLVVTGRIKEILITSGGENIAPRPIEEALLDELSSLLSQAIVIGDKRKFLSVLLTLKTEVSPDGVPTNILDNSVLDWCSNIVGKHEIKTVEDFRQMNEFNDKIQNAIEKVNQMSVSRAAKVQKFLILPQDLSISGGELGPTMKLKRHFVYQKYQDDIDKLYES